MNNETAAESVMEEVKATEVSQPVAEKDALSKEEKAPVKESAATAAVKKAAPKASSVKKAAAEKPVKSEVAEKSASKPAKAAKVVKKAPAASKAKAVEVTKADKPAKVKKPKLVRDSFTIPENDYALFESLKQRALAAGVEVKKSEILRIALVTLAKLDEDSLVKAIGLVERIKTGRPKK